MADETKSYTWKKVKPFLFTILAVVIAVIVFSVITKTVEVDDKGKVVDGGKQYRTKLRFGNRKVKGIV